MKKIKRFIWLIIIILILFFVGKFWWNSQFDAVSSSKTEKVIVVSRGESFNQVADKLKTENLIKSTWAFKIKAKQPQYADKLEPGTFKLSESLSVDQILKVITSSPLDTWVTLLEGWRVEEMAQKLNSELGIENSEFLKSAEEGYMFPDTYLFPKGYSGAQIAKRLKDTFEERYTSELKAKIKAQGLTEKQGVILASIVEREARSYEVRQKVASILLKRFKIGMGLNADATVQYALVSKGSQKTPTDGWWKKRIFYEDLEIESPYNTYIHAGLPPAPICNPSASSLKAVADATSTPYLYYFHDTEGNSYYAKTLEEHNINVENHR